MKLRNLTYFSTYVGIYTENSGYNTVYFIPISIADIDDNDNFHQLNFSTSDKIVKNLNDYS